MKRAVLWSLSGWLLLSVMYAALLYAQSSGAMGPALSLRVALKNTVAPTVMAGGVWWLTGRFPWPESKLARFLFGHAALACVFAALWSAWLVFVVAGLGSSMLHGALAWHFVMGVMLYGSIAAGSYATRGALRTRDLRLVAERADRLRIEAELSALRAHIDPHFLFNTLHSVSELLRSEPHAAERSIEQLSDLFRYTLRLDRHGSDIVRLEDEWSFTLNYLALEQTRMGERLRVDAAIDDDALDCLVPPFTVQPLVENAIRHGLGPKPSGGTLVIRIHEDAGQLHIHVSDDGIGVDSARLRQSNGLGLRSVTQRLAARHDGRAIVDIAPLQAGGTSVHVALPAQFTS